MQVLGYRIREARLAAGLTQEQLARKADVPLRSLSAWEAGENQPRIEGLSKIAAALEKPLDFFVPPTGGYGDDGAADLVEKVGMLMVKQARRSRMGMRR